MIKKTSIPVSELIPIDFNSDETLKAMDIAPENFNESTGDYVDLLNLGKFGTTYEKMLENVDKKYDAAVANLESQYTQAVLNFEAQLDAQETDAQLSANIAIAAAENMASEAQPGLGTGAAGVRAAGYDTAQKQTIESIEDKSAETYATGIETLSTSYAEGVESLNEAYQTELMSRLEAVFGKYDSETGTFAGLAEYEYMSNAVGEATAKTLALLLNPKVNTDNDDWIQVLKDAGYVESTSATGEVTLNDTAVEQLDMLINGIHANEPAAALGDKTFLYAVAEQIAKANYADEYVSESGQTSWEMLLESKRRELTMNNLDWIHKNKMGLRVTAWDLYSRDDEKIEVDTEYSIYETIPSEFGNNINSTSGVPVGYITTDKPFGEDSKSLPCSDEELTAFKQDILTGKIPDGSFITFRTDRMEEGDKYYYVQNGVIYETEYDAENPPKIINLESANEYSFGLYRDVGKQNEKGKGKQDLWTREIIESAKAGKIPDGTYIRMNYGAETRKTMGNSWYKYSDGKFIRVSGDTKVPVTATRYGKPSGTEYVSLDSATNYDSTVDMIYHYGTEWSVEYIDW